MVWLIFYLLSLKMNGVWIVVIIGFSILIFLLILLSLFFMMGSTTGTGFQAILSSAYMVPPYTSVPGHGAVEARLDGNILSYRIRVEDLGPGVEVQVPGNTSHFHRGGPTVNGPILQPVNLVRVGDQRWEASGVWNLTDADRNDLLSVNVYYNVRTIPYPLGQIRGQMLIVPFVPSV